MPDLWERLPDETPEAYAAFLFFLAEGLGRRVGDTYHKHRRGQERASKQWHAWSQQYRWSERATAYDAQHTDLHSKLTTQTVIEMINLLAQEGVAAVKEKRTPFAGWRENMDLLHALAALVSENDPKPMEAAKVYRAAAVPPLPDQPDGLCPPNPGRPFAPGPASASPN